MAHICLVCNTHAAALPGNNQIKNVFNETILLGSERKLLATLCEMLEVELEECGAIAKGLCGKCYQICSNYDMYRANMNTLKTKIQEQYKVTAENNTLTEMASIEPVQESPPKKKGPFVVPASKLHPVPADFQLNLGKIAAVTVANSQALTQKPLLNLKVTIGDSVLTQSLTTSTVKITKPILENEHETVDLEDWNVDSLLSHNDNGDNDNGDNDNGDIANGDNDNGDSDNYNGSEMEIDADCGLDQSQSDSIVLDVSEIKTEHVEANNAHYIETDNLTYGNIRILGDGTDEQHTIVVDSDNSILQMISGQKLVYENGELSLVMDHEDDDNGQDSNDEESQIELQVSGDEETANAIIAAAQEQGGAFIKVESGEMYRVKSVQSAPAEPRDIAALLVTREGDKYRCLVCDNSQGSIKKSFKSKAQEMMNHMKSEHSAKVYICVICGVVMRNRAEYYTHITEHKTNMSSNSTKQRLYQCEVCQKTYNSRTLLQEHLNTHTGSRPHACHICNKAFASKYTRQAHLKTHQSRPRPYKCGECGKRFLSQQNLNQHEKTHLGIKSFVCNLCNKAFGTQHNLEVHGIIHSGVKSHVCDICTKAFARRAELVDHKRIHTGERPFECDVCGAKFSQRSNLHSHKRATHYDDKRHACPDCPKRFKRRRLLQYHIKAAHTGERPLTCEVCKATFVYPEHYKKHIKIHSGDRPYYCEICGKAFSSRDNRNTHRFVHSDKKPYECLACGASYMRKRMLVQHMNANGHLAESIVVNQPRVTKVNEHSIHPAAEIKLLDIEKDEEAKYEDEEDDEEEEDMEHSNTKLYTLKVDEAADTEGVDAAALLTSVNAEELGTEMTDENGSVLRFIQVKMSDGNSGWVALNN